jgi:antibiotic biosynthesis monooxygenase (ABM) superfamily enzyme
VFPAARLFSVDIGMRLAKNLPAHILDPAESTFMYIHMFAFRLKPGVNTAQKEHIISEIGKLQGQIPGLEETRVGRNVSPRGQGYEIGGVMRFKDQASLEAYGTHPAHKQLLSWLLPMIEPIEVDFPA